MNGLLIDITSESGRERVVRYVRNGEASWMGRKVLAMSAIDIDRLRGVKVLIDWPEADPKWIYAKSLSINEEVS